MCSNKVQRIFLSSSDLRALLSHQIYLTDVFCDALNLFASKNDFAKTACFMRLSICRSETILISKIQKMCFVYPLRVKIMDSILLFLILYKSLKNTY